MSHAREFPWWAIHFLCYFSFYFVIFFISQIHGKSLHIPPRLFNHVLLSLFFMGMWLAIEVDSRNSFQCETLYKFTKKKSSIQFQSLPYSILLLSIYRFFIYLIWVLFVFFFNYFFMLIKLVIIIVVNHSWTFKILAIASVLINHSNLVKSTLITTDILYILISPK